MWRKNREPNSGSACVGTDLNRNFDTGCWNCELYFLNSVSIISLQCILYIAIL